LTRTVRAVGRHELTTALRWGGPRCGSTSWHTRGLCNLKSPSNDGPEARENARSSEQTTPTTEGAAAEGGAPGIWGSFKAWWNKEDKPELLREREAIKAEMKKGYFDDVKAAEQFAVGTSSASLLPNKSAKAFAAITARSLQDQDVQLPVSSLGTVSLVTVAARESAQAHVDSWTEPIAAVFGKEALYAQPGGEAPSLYHINVMEGHVGSMLSTIIRSKLRRQLPAEQHGAVLHWNGDVTTLGLEVANRHVGHVYMLDKNGRVRWRGRGQATPEQADRLVAFAQTLMKEEASSPGVKKKRR